MAVQVSGVGSAKEPLRLITWPFRTLTQFAQAGRNRGAGQTGSFRDQGNPTITQGSRFARRPLSAQTFSHQRPQKIKLNS